MVFLNLSKNRIWFRKFLLTILVCINIITESNIFKTVHLSLSKTQLILKNSEHVEEIRD